MRLIQPAELTRMRLAQGQTLNDTFQHVERQTAKNEYGQPDETWVLGQSFSCGFEPLGKEEDMDDTEVPAVDAKLRISLALDGLLEHVDRVKITHRFGEAVDSPMTFEIVGMPERGPSGLVYMLKRVTDGSDV